MSPPTVRPSPAPTRIWGGIVHAQPARGMSARPVKPPARRITPHATPWTIPSDCGRRRPTASAVAGMTVTTRPAAAGDIPQPSTRRRTTRKSAATRPPATRSSAAFAVDRRPPRRRRHGAGGDVAHRNQQREGQRHLHEEDRLPAQELRQDPSGGGPERRAEHTGGDPDVERALVGALEVREEIERRL